MDNATLIYYVTRNGSISSALPRHHALIRFSVMSCDQIFAFDSAGKRVVIRSRVTQ